MKKFILIFSIFYILNFSLISLANTNKESDYTTIIPQDEQYLVEGNVVLPDGINLKLSDLEVTFLRFSKTKISENGSFIIPMKRDELNSLEIYLPKNIQGQTAILLSSQVFPNENQITINAESTAVELLYGPSIVVDGKLIDQSNVKVKKVIAKGIPNFIAYLSNNLIRNPYFLNNLNSEPKIIDVYKLALKNAQAAVKKSVDTGELKIAKTTKEHHAEHEINNESLDLNMSERDEILLQVATNGFLKAYTNANASQLEAYLANEVNFLGAYSLFSENLPRAHLSHKSQTQVINAYQELFKAVGKDKWQNKMKSLNPSIESSNNSEYRVLYDQGLFKKGDIIYDLHFREMLKGERRGLVESQVFVFRKIENSYKIIGFFSGVDFL